MRNIIKTNCMRESVYNFEIFWIILKSHLKVIIIPSLLGMRVMIEVDKTLEYVTFIITSDIQKGKAGTKKFVQELNINRSTRISGRHTVFLLLFVTPFDSFAFCYPLPLPGLSHFTSLFSLSLPHPSDWFVTKDNFFETY